MLDRVIEVLAVYGAIMLVIVLAARNVGQDIKPMLIGWTFIAWVPGLIYIIVGILPGQ